MTNSLKRKILVLDDDRIQHLLFRKRVVLLKLEIDLVFFEDAVSAIDYIKTSPPDIVISDIYLQKVDGWQFLEMIKQLRYDGKFYLHSGSIHPDDRIRATRDSSVSGFFEKPIQESDLKYILGK
jgi:CheY-like chemotaxis protein